MTRQEHLDWCKKRAFEFLDAGDVHGAWASMVSDLPKHKDTERHAAIELCRFLVLAGQLNEASQVERFIYGVN